jgi:Cysteine-rich secretory protein family
MMKGPTLTEFEPASVQNEEIMLAKPLGLLPFTITIFGIVWTGGRIQNETSESGALLQTGLGRINDLRAKLGLEPAVADDRLSRAAEAHARCMGMNYSSYFQGLSWHEERANLAGFSGEKPIDRVRHFGYDGGCWECIEGTPVYVKNGPTQFAKPFPPGPMINAVYHRLPFIAPGKLRVGIGRGLMSTVYDMDLEETRGIVVYPYFGATDVSASIWAGESPDPFRIHHEHPKGFGCPVSIQVRGYGRIQFQKSTLTSDSEGEVPILINTSSNDNALRDGELLILPKNKYKPHQTYLARVEFLDQRGVEHSVSTSFKTGK